MFDVIIPESTHGFSSNTYIIKHGDECAIIDPSVPYSQRYTQNHIKYILLTHAHFDHMLDIDAWVKATGARVIVSRHDKPALSDGHKNCYSLFIGKDFGFYGDSTEVDNGDILPLGDGIIKVVGCPGHTPGSVVYLADRYAFVGDTIFAGGGYGRCDLPGGNIEHLKDSIRRILSLPDDTVLYTGHGDSTTVREYKLYYNKIF